ncbi:L-rhamnose mutarotase [Curtobacterium sp. RRHDQ10]
MHTRLAPGSEEDYERVHAVVPAALADRLRHAGVHDWRIWRDGLDLFHVIDVEDYRSMRRVLADDPVNAEWQAIVNPLLAASDDYSGNDDGVPRVWSLADQLATASEPAGSADPAGSSESSGWATR